MAATRCLGWAAPLKARQQMQYACDACDTTHESSHGEEHHAGDDDEHNQGEGRHDWGHKALKGSDPQGWAGGLSRRRWRGGHG